VSDDDGASFNGTPPGSPSKQSNSKLFASWGTNLLRGKKKENSSSALLSATGPIKMSSSLDDGKSIKINSTQSNVDTCKMEEVSMQSSDSPDNEESRPPEQSSKDAVIPSSSDPFQNQIAVMASTLTQPLFLLDGTIGLCPPQLKVSQHGLTVRNTINKKWSTVRCSCRLTSGVHQWEIYIDRCISKNIFLGVVGPEARADNYVGCDKYGWAFLANRAVWFNKGKLKSYGELFRTGDVVQVTLDLDVGGSLSFSINGKDLGVAVEGLSGPLYPAFSLYNEDDQISLSPPRQPLFMRCDDESGEAQMESTLAKMAYDVDGFSDGRKGNSGTANAERVVQRLETVQNILRFVAAGSSYSGSAATKSTVPVFPAKQFLTPSIVTELVLRWSLWRRKINLRTVRVQNGEVITLLVSSVLSLRMSDHRYCPGDLIQWEQHQFVVLGVGRHQLWFQKTSGSGEVIGFTEESLHALHIKNAIRLVKKRSTLHRARTAKHKGAGYPPAGLPSSLSGSSLYSQENQEEVSGRSAPEPATDNSTGQTCPLSDFSELNFENPSVLNVALIDEADKWTHIEDSCLLEWLELRARILGTHPLNMALEQIVSPINVMDQIQTLGYVEVVESQIGCLNSTSNSTSAINEFATRFAPLKAKSLMSLRLRALLLLHLNDTLSPLLSLIFDPNTVNDPGAAKATSFDLLSPLNTVILAHRHVILAEVKFGLGFRLGWSTLMSPSMLEGGANNVATMLQKKTVLMDRKHQSFADGAPPATNKPSNDDEISFSVCPVELPILPYKSVSISSANVDRKAAADSTLTTICALNSLNNPLHPSNVATNGNSKSNTTTNAQSSTVKTAPFGVDSNVNLLSVYYFEDSTSCFLNWSTVGLSSPTPSTPTSSASALPPSMTGSNIHGLPVINMFVVEPQRLHKGVSEYAKKCQLQQVFEQDFRWRLLANFQSSLLGQFMQTIERLDVQQLTSKATSGAPNVESDSATSSENSSFLSQVAPQGPWYRVLRSVFRAGMFWDDHMSPSSRPVSVYVHFLPQTSESYKKEHRTSKRDRMSGTIDSARSGTTLTPRQVSTPTASTPNPSTPHTDVIPESEMLSARDKDIDREKEKEDILRSLSLLPPASGQPISSPGNAAPASRLQRVFQLLQINSAQLMDGTPAGMVSPWSLLQIYIVEAVAEVQPLLASSLLSSEDDFFCMDDSELDQLARQDVLCHFLAKHASFDDMGQESSISNTSSSSVAGVINLHLHIMHSLGVLLGVSLRHGITPNIKMSSYFWQLLSKSHVNPYAPASKTTGGSEKDARNSKAGLRVQEIYNGVRESCGRALRHGVVSILPEDFLDLLQERELRVLLAGGGSSCVEHLRSVSNYIKPLQASDAHIEMFWTALSDLPRGIIIRFLHGLWSRGNADKSLPEELFYWKHTGSTLGTISFADMPNDAKTIPAVNSKQPQSNSDNGIMSPGGAHPHATQHPDSQLIHMSDDHVIHVPRYSSMDAMRAKLKFFIDSL